MERNLGKIFFDTYYLYIPEKIENGNTYLCKEIPICHQYATSVRPVSFHYLNQLKIISRQKAVSILNNYDKERSGCYKHAFSEAYYKVISRHPGSNSFYKCVKVTGDFKIYNDITIGSMSLIFKVKASEFNKRYKLAKEL